MKMRFKLRSEVLHLMSQSLLLDASTEECCIC